MKTCTFFGHRNCPDNIEAELFKIIEELIKTESVDKFYVGNQGAFDRIVYKVLCDLKRKYTHVCCYVVVAYMPKTNDNIYAIPTIYPEGLEKIPPQFAVTHRNRWMINNSQIAVTYVIRGGSGAGKFSEMAKKKGLVIINIATK